jgi:hypothetical protein
VLAVITDPGGAARACLLSIGCTSIPIPGAAVAAALTIAMATSSSGVSRSAVAAVRFKPP